MINLDIKKLVLLLSMVTAISACQPEDEKNQNKAEDAKQTESAPTESTISEQDKMGYALGAKMATYIRIDIDSNELLNITKESVAQGFKDGLDGKTQLTEQEIAAQFAEFQQKMQAAQQQKAAIDGQKQAEEDKLLIAAGDAFLAENAKKEGVKTTESGLQYLALTEVKQGAAKPADTDVVKVHYTGSLIDGSVFDSSVERGEPISFPLNRVIKGWTEGLQLMGIGSKYHFVIPWQLAYGAPGRPGSIPRNAVLQFEVELIEINPEAEKAEEKK